jgi:hypothetical protein
MEVGNLLENLYDDWTVWFIAMKTERQSKGANVTKADIKK